MLLVVLNAYSSFIHKKNIHILMVHQIKLIERKHINSHLLMHIPDLLFKEHLFNLDSKLRGY
jgi:hypothetical protein